MKEAKNKEGQNNLIFNETMANLIINNIISSVIRIAHNKSIYKDIGGHCFNYLIKLINPYLKIEYLPYEMINNSNSNHGKIKVFYNSYINPKSDIWTNITEPLAPKIDSYTNRIYISKLEKNHNINEEIKIDKDSYNKLNDDKYNKFNKDINNNNFSKFKKENNKNNNILTKSNEFKKMKENKNIEINEPNDEIYKDYKVIIRKKRHTNVAMLGSKNVRDEMDRMIEMPSFDILNDNKDKNILKNDELAKLRKDIINLKIKKNKIEETKNLFIVKNRKGNKPLKHIFIKHFDNNRLTFDPNGKIIHLNLHKLSPISSEFISPRQKIIGNLDYENMKKAHKRLSFKKPIITSFEKYNFKPNENIKYTKNNESKITKENYNELAKDTNEASKDVNNFEKIEYNPADHRSSFYFNKFSNQRKKLIISGTNFEKIIPEVGVIIHNGNKKNQKKFGGFQYFSKYDRPSLNELSKIIDNNKKFGSVNISSLSFNSENNEYNNYNGYNEEFNENDNPLFQNVHYINSKERILSSFSNNKSINEINNNDINNSSNKINIKRNFKSSLNNLPSRHKSIENSVDNIKLSPKKNINDIYNLLMVEEKNQINENNKSPFEKDKTSKNIMSIKELIDLKRKFLIMDKLDKKREDIVKGRKIISNFNYNIIQNKNWGNNYNLGNKEDNKIINSKIHFRKDIFRKFKIAEEKKINFKRKLFHSSSTGELIS